MTSPDDLTSLFVGSAGTDLPFRQGVVSAFDPTTGANTIDVGGASLTNLPLLNIGDTINLTTGDVVVLMKMKSAWAILGRVVVPGSSSINSSAVGFQGDGSQLSVTSFALTTSFQTFGTFTITCPLWANFVSIFATAQCSAVNSTAANDILRIICDINGTGGGEQLQYAPPTGTTGGRPVSVFTSNNYTSAATAGQTFVCNTRVRTDTAGWASSGFNIANLHVNAIFTKV